MQVDDSMINFGITGVSTIVAVVAFTRTMSREGRGDLESMRREFDAKLEKVAADARTARHDAAGEMQRQIGSLDNEIRSVRKEAQTKLEASEMEKRLMERMRELSHDVKQILHLTTNTRQVIQP